MGQLRLEVGERDRREFGDDGYVHYLGCGNDFKGVYICQNLSNWML